MKCIAEMEGVISVLPNHRLNLHTTRSWDFMGFPSKGKVGSPQEGDVIIGLLDTGYYIKHTIVTNSLWVNNKANAQIWSFSTSVVLQESGQNLIASTMKGLALHLVNGRVNAKEPTSPATSELSFCLVLMCTLPWVQTHYSLDE